MGGAGVRHVRVDDGILVLGVVLTELAQRAEAPGDRLGRPVGGASVAALTIVKLRLQVHVGTRRLARGIK